MKAIAAVLALALADVGLAFALAGNGADLGMTLDSVAAYAGSARTFLPDLEADLTQRQRQVLELLGDGRTMGQIASRLGISPRTVETHVTSLYRKLGVRTRVQAISRAATLGLVEL